MTMGPRALRLAAYAAAAVVLAGVFALYTRPELMVDIGNMVWACFR
jgi:hypothetical protein